MAVNPDSASGSTQPMTEPEFTSKEDIVLGQEMSKIHFGTVRVAKHRCEEAKLYSVKLYTCEDLDAEDFVLIEKEVSNMRKLNHANILPLTASFVNMYNIQIISPLLPMGSVSKIIQNEALGFQYGLPEHAIAIIVADVIQALTYLHERQLIHRSIKSSHILLDQSGSAVLTGFRYMVQKTQEAPLHVDDLDKMTHNLHWLSPEILNQDRGGYSENSDIYSLGMTILEMGNGIAALDTNTPSLMFLKKVGCPSPSLMDVNNSYDQEMQKFESCHQGGGDTGPEMKGTTSEAEDKRRDNAFKLKEYGSEIKTFVECCLIKQRERRPGVEDLRRHKFLKIYSKANHSLVICLLGKPIEFEAEFKEPAISANSSFSWDF